MQIESFKVFCDLVHTSSFSESARLNGVTQSAVSQQIRNLEERYGVTFFERGKKTFSITPEGEIFHAAALQIVDIYRSVGDDIDALKGKIAGQLRIATISSIGFHDLPPIVDRFREEFPEVDLHVDYKRSDAVYHEVLSGHANLGLVACPVKVSGAIMDVFSKDRLVVVVPPGHKLAGRKRVKPEALSGMDFVAFEPDQPTRRALDKIFRSLGVSVRPTLEFDNIESVKRAVEVTGAMSIVPESAVKGEVEAGRLCSSVIEGKEFWRPLGVIRRQACTTSQAMRAFLKCLLG